MSMLYGCEVVCVKRPLGWLCVCVARVSRTSYISGWPPDAKVEIGVLRFVPGEN